MAKDFTHGLKIKSFDEIFGNSGDGSALEQAAVQIKLNELHSFKDHPFRVVDDEDMEELVQSIQEIGVITPIEVRPDQNGYEIISGHRRTFASRKAGLTMIPAIINELPDYLAVLRMTAANKYRSTIYPSEKAHAYKMQYEALKEKVRVEREDGIKQDKRTDALLADSVGETRSTVQRYLKLNNLTEDLLGLVDSGDLSLTAAQPLANLEYPAQELIYTIWDMYHRPKLSQEVCEELYAIYLNQKDTLRENDILMCFGLLKEVRVKPVKVTLNEKRLSRYFPNDYSQERIEEIIDKLLTDWAKENEFEYLKREGSIENGE